MKAFISASYLILKEPDNIVQGSLHNINNSNES